jgi:hypothetical protein
MATEVLRGTIDWITQKDIDLHSIKENQVPKKVFKIGGLEKYRIPRISKQSIILPTCSRISF